MCYFISAVISGIDVAEFNTALRNADTDVQFSEVPTPGIQSQLKSGEHYLIHDTGASCDCDTWLGAANRMQSHDNLDKEVAKLRKRGWTETRIERWRSEKQESAGRADQRFADNKDNLPWIRVIQTALANGATGFGLLLHWYDGDLDDARFSITRQQSPAPTAELLSTMPEDTLLY
jgi:hypothetical protein